MLTTQIYLPFAPVFRCSCKIFLHFFCLMIVVRHFYHLLMPSRNICMQDIFYHLLLIYEQMQGGLQNSRDPLQAFSPQAAAARFSFWSLYHESTLRACGILIVLHPEFILTLWACYFYFAHPISPLYVCYVYIKHCNKSFIIGY